jgi:hypothetical protein
VFPGQVSSFPSSNGSGRGALDSSGPTTLKRISHVVVGRKSRNPFCRIVCRMVHFFVVGGYPLVSGLTPAAESFSSPGLLEDSAHWSIAEPCRNSSTPCEVGCDQKLASDSSGLSGGFSGQRAWVRIFKKWAPGSYCLELVVACPAAGTSAQFLLVEGSGKQIRSER